MADEEGRDTSEEINPTAEEQQGQDGELPATELIAEGDSALDASEALEDDPEEVESTADNGAGKSEDGEESRPTNAGEDEATDGDAEPPGEHHFQEDAESDSQESGEEDNVRKKLSAGQLEDKAPLPKSENFAAGERPETGLETAAEVLSRGSASDSSLDDLDEADELDPDTPEQESEEDGETTFPRLSREELVERYHAAWRERGMLNNKNHFLQNKLAEYFRRKKTEDSRQEVDRNVTDQEQRYLKYMSNLDDLRQQEASEKESYNEQIEEMKERKLARQTLVEEEWKHYCDFKRSVALSSVNSRSGRPLTLKEFEIYEVNEAKKEIEVSQVRLENIRLKNRIRKREVQLKQKEELAEGLHLIDFEQLKIENQTYNEKIEERNEELMKLRKKITSTVQVLTHIKEKLQFVQGENQVAKHELGRVDGMVAGKRDLLARTKQARDALRHDNAKLQQKCGLLGNRLLLRDYEDGTNEIAELNHRLDQYKRTHAELVLNISGVKKKLDETKSQVQTGHI